MAQKVPGIKRLPDGRYFVRVTARDPRTRVKVHRKRTLDPMPLEDAVIVRAEMAKELKAELAAGRRSSNSRNDTVADYAEQWMARKAKRLRASVQAHYISILSSRVLPQLGSVNICSVTRADVDEWVAWTERQTTRQGRAYSRETLHSWYRVLGTLLRDAAAEYGFADPTHRVRPPRSRVRNVREKKTLTAEQLGRLLETAKNHFKEWYAEIYVLATSGMRPGELYALHWEDLDHERGCLHVRRAVWNGHEDDTKTDAPRDLAMPQAIAGVLQLHRERLVREQHPGLEAGLVFPASYRRKSTGWHRTPAALRKTLRQCAQIAEIEIKVGPQVLRRTFNTLLLEAGVNQVVLRSQMGHTTQAMTERYAGVHIERKQEAVSALIEAVRK